MLSKEEIDKAKDDLMFFNEGDYITREMDKSADVLGTYIKELEEIKGMKEAIELSGMDIKDLVKFKHENERLRNKANQLEQENNKRSKIIDEMAEYLAIIRDCPNEDKGANLDCENRCSNDDSLYTECWKQYFEQKVEEI